MTTTTRLGADAVNVAADAVGARLNSGYARIYSGSRPTTADTAITDQVLLAEAQFGNPAFGAASGGQITANAIAEVTCITSGTPAWFRALRSNGTTVEFDDTVGTENAALIISAATVNANQPLQITSLTFRIPQTAE